MFYQDLTLAILGLSATVTAQCTGPAVNSATTNLIKSFESFKPNVYNDPTGNPTIGYGHLCTRANCGEVNFPIPLSEADGERLLANDLRPAQQCITTKTGSNVVLNANQYGAFVSWAFNVGCGNVGTSTLLRRLNAGENPNTVAEEELPKWNKSGGQTLPGLTRRRAAEVNLAKTATTARALPACS